MVPGHDDIVDDGDIDELSSETKVPHLPNNPVSTTVVGKMLRGKIKADAADVEIMGSKLGTGMNKKRQHARLLDDGEDELGQDQDSKRTTLRGKARGLNSRTSVDASLSSKGDILPTWPEAAKRIRLISAVCRQRYLYQANKSQPPHSAEDFQLYFMPDETNHDDLYACTAEGQRAAQSPWLKITGSTQSLEWDPRGPYIKVRQRAEPKEDIAALMVLQFANQGDASEVIRWARTRLGIQVNEGTAYLSLHDIGMAEILTWFQWFCRKNFPQDMEGSRGIQ